MARERGKRVQAAPRTARVAKLRASAPGRRSTAGKSPAAGKRHAAGKRPVARRTPPTARGPRDVLLEFSMSPFDKGASLSAYVARSLDIIDRSGVPYRLNPMGTVIEGSWDEVLGVVTQCFERMRVDCDRISVAVKIDYRKGRTGRLESKIASVERRLGRKVKTG
jgi:uncharacterized protein (TIGR00106 family)